MKIVEAVNSMITNSQLITNVIKNDTEYFFLFNEKYKWSINKSDTSDEYYIFLYPKDDKLLEELAITNFSEYSDFISYRTEEIKTKEARESFAELYQIASSKVFGVDNILDDIISLDL